MSDKHEIDAQGYWNGILIIRSLNLPPIDHAFTTNCLIVSLNKFQS